MSILIDMEMPSGCEVLTDNGYQYCSFLDASGNCELQKNKTYEGWNEQYNNCPISEVKPSIWIKSGIVGFHKCSNCGALWDDALVANIFFKHCPRCGSPIERKKDVNTD